MKRLYPWHLFFTAHKMKFSIKNFFGKCDQTHSFLRIWPRLLKKSLTENFIFGAVFALAFLHRLERWSWKFRTFCEYVFEYDFPKPYFKIFRVCMECCRQGNLPLNWKDLWSKIKTKVKSPLLNIQNINFVK